VSLCPQQVLWTYRPAVHSSTVLCPTYQNRWKVTQGTTGYSCSRTKSDPVLRYLAGLLPAREVPYSNPGCNIDWSDSKSVSQSGRQLPVTSFPIPHSQDIPLSDSRQLRYSNTADVHWVLLFVVSIVWDMWIQLYSEGYTQTYRQAVLSIYISNCVLKALMAEFAGQQAAWKVRFRRRRILKRISSSGTVKRGLAYCGSDRDVGLPSARR
jgi:hypothetical protein